MCNPVAISAAGAGLSLMQKQDQADQMNRNAYRQAEAINKATVDSYAQLNRQGVEDAQNASVEGSKLNREMTSRVATARASAAGAGIGGLSVDALLLDLSGKGMEAATTAETNYARSVASRTDQAKELQNRNAGEKSRLQMASGVSGLDIVGAGLMVGNSYLKEQRYQAALASGKPPQKAP